MMKISTTPAFYFLLFPALFFAKSLSGQNPDAVISSFKGYSYFTNGQVADSVFYHPEAPESGAMEFLDDSLEVYSTNGRFELNYLPTVEAVFVGIWVDLNNNGLFEKDEQIYKGAAKEGNLVADVVLPIPDVPIRAFVATSKDEGRLDDPRVILLDNQISSLQFIIRSAPPKLTMTSKKDTRDTSEIYCMSIPMELISGPGFPCLTINEWQLNYPVGVSAQVDSNIIELPGGSLFMAGDTIQTGNYFEFELDFSSYPINDGDVLELVCYFSYCDDPLAVDSVAFSFTKECMIDRVNDPTAYIDQVRVYPNPVVTEAQIEYELITASQVRLALHDLNGRLVQVIQTAQLPVGKQRLIFRPNQVPPGIYLLSWQTPNTTVTKKIVILAP